MSETMPVSEWIKSRIATMLERTGAEHIVFSSFSPSEYVMRNLVEAGIRFKVVLGRYNEEYETSYIIAADYFEWLMQSDLVDGQESFLTMNQKEEAYLVYSQFDDEKQLRIEELGAITTLDPARVKDIAAWTYDPTAGMYFGTTEKAA